MNWPSQPSPALSGRPDQAVTLLTGYFSISSKDQNLKFELNEVIASKNFVSNFGAKKILVFLVKPDFSIFLYFCDNSRAI